MRLTLQNKKYLIYGVSAFGLVICLFLFIRFVSFSHVKTFLSHVTQWWNYKLENVIIVGRENIEEQKIQSLVESYLQQNIFSIPINEIQQKIRQLPEVSSALVRRVYPNQLMLFIREREVTVIWFDGARYNYLDYSGKILQTVPEQEIGYYPFVTGKSANLHLHEFISMLKAVPGYQSRVIGGEYVAERRWNLHFKNGYVVYLPEKAPLKALTKINWLDQKYHILDKDMEILDLRHPEHVVLRMNNEKNE